MERARTQLDARRPGPWWGRLLRWVCFRQLLPRPDRLRRLAYLLRHYQRGGPARRSVRAVLGRAHDALGGIGSGCGWTVREYDESLLQDAPDTVGAAKHPMATSDAVGAPSTAP